LRFVAKVILCSPQLTGPRRFNAGRVGFYVSIHGGGGCQLTGPRRFNAEVLDRDQLACRHPELYGGFQNGLAFVDRHDSANPFGLGASAVDFPAGEWRRLAVGHAGKYRPPDPAVQWLPYARDFDLQRRHATTTQTAGAFGFACPAQCDGQLSSTVTQARTKFRAFDCDQT
jgi:hypothetical protein